LRQEVPHVTAVLRAYRPGDEDPIVELSNRCLAPYAGWVPRTVDYWRWSTLLRPGVDPTDILLLETGGKLVGYTALGCDGDVLDFCVDPDQPARGRRALIEQLIGALEDHARLRRCDFLTFSEPASDRLVDEALRASGYVVEQNQFFSLGVLNPQYLLQEILLARQSRLAALRNTRFVFELTPGRYPFLLNTRLLVQLHPSVEVRDVSDAAECPGECVIRMDLCALTELIFSAVTVASLRQQSQLEIRPAASVADAHKLLDAIAVRARWHVPRSDGF
jgi:hypothetical protein